MRRAVVALLCAAALAGCGGGDGGDGRTSPLPPPGVSEKQVDEAQQALERLGDTDLPEDARRELEEAKQLLDDARG